MQLLLLHVLQDAGQLELIHVGGAYSLGLLPLKLLELPVQDFVHLAVDLALLEKFLQLQNGLFLPTDDIVVEGQLSQPFPHLLNQKTILGVLLLQP